MSEKGWRNLEELKRLAEVAGGENWRAGNCYGKTFIPAYQVIADTPDGPCVILEGNKNFLDQAIGVVAFVAAANPSAVLELIAEVKRLSVELAKSQAGKEMRAAIIYADECFDAASCEGWAEALANGDIDRIRDIWDRRISRARDLFPSAIRALEVKP